MKRSLGLFCLLLSCATICFSQTEKDSLSAEQVIYKMIDKMGGEDYLRSVKTLYSEMVIEQGGREMIWITKEMLPNKGAFQVVIDGRVVFETKFNGKKGYEWQNGTMKSTPKKELEDKFLRNNIYNELDFLDKKRYTLERMPDETVKGQECYKLKATLKIDIVRVIYVAKETYNIVKEEQFDKKSPSKVNSTYFSDYKKFGEIYYYGKITMGNEPDAMVGIMKKLVVNDLIKDSDFEK